MPTAQTTRTACLGRLGLHQRASVLFAPCKSRELYSPCPAERQLGLRGGSFTVKHTTVCQPRPRRQQQAYDGAPQRNVSLFSSAMIVSCLSGPDRVRAVNRAGNIPTG